MSHKSLPLAASPLHSLGLEVRAPAARERRETWIPLQRKATMGRKTQKRRSLSPNKTQGQVEQCGVKISMHACGLGQSHKPIYKIFTFIMLLLLILFTEKHNLTFTVSSSLQDEEI